MERYTVIGIGAEFGKGCRLLLTPEQAAPRADRLKKTKDKNVYAVEKPVQFGVGECLGAEGPFDVLPFQDLLITRQETPKPAPAQGALE